MTAAGNIIVIELDDSAATQAFGISLGPLDLPALRPHRVGGGNQTKSRESVGVLFPFNDEHPLIRIGLHQIGFAVENRFDSLEGPDPAALAIWPALREFLGLVPDGLVNQFTI